MHARSCAAPWYLPNLSREACVSCSLHLQLLPLLDDALYRAQEVLLAEHPSSTALMPKPAVHARLSGLALHHDSTARDACPTPSGVGAAHAGRLLTVAGTVTKTGKSWHRPRLDMCQLLWQPLTGMWVLGGSPCLSAWDQGSRMWVVHHSCRAGQSSGGPARVRVLPLQAQAGADFSTRFCYMPMIGGTQPGSPLHSHSSLAHQLDALCYTGLQLCHSLSSAAPALLPCAVS